MADQYASIIIDISHEDVDRAFQYRIPPAASAERFRSGQQVRIPFGFRETEQRSRLCGGTHRPGPDYDDQKLKDDRQRDRARKRRRGVPAHLSWPGG